MLVMPNTLRLVVAALGCCSRLGPIERRKGEFSWSLTAGCVFKSPIENRPPEEPLVLQWSRDAASVFPICVPKLMPIFIKSAACSIEQGGKSRIGRYQAFFSAKNMQNKFHEASARHQNKGFPICCARNATGKCPVSFNADSALP
jgi:hypothetical protein